MIAFNCKFLFLFSSFWLQGYWFIYLFYTVTLRMLLHKSFMSNLHFRDDHWTENKKQNFLFVSCPRWWWRWVLLILKLKWCSLQLQPSASVIITLIKWAVNDSLLNLPHVQQILVSVAALCSCSRADILSTFGF